MKQHLLLILLFASVNCSAFISIDTIPPVITLNGPALIDHVLNSAYVDSGATAMDDVDGNITSSIVSDISAVNPDVDHTGSYTIIYSVSDLAGNIGTATRTIHVFNQADFLLTSNYDGVDSCQFGFTSLFAGSITTSDSINLRFTIKNFGGFGSNVYITGWLTDTGLSATIYFSAGQGLGGSAILTLSNGSILSLNPVIIRISYMWTDGLNNEQCVSTYNTNQSVSISEIVTGSSVKYFPNPTDGIINLNSSEENIRDVSIYDCHGVLIRQEKINNISARIDLSNNAIGIYFIRITTDEGQQTCRIVRR